MPGTTGRLPFGDLSVVGIPGAAQTYSWCVDRVGRGARGRLAGGDRDAALVLVRRFQARVFGLALSITRYSGRAEEAAQDTSPKAWRYAASFDPGRGPRHRMAVGIARNAALDLAEERGRSSISPAIEPATSSSTSSAATTLTARTRVLARSPARRPSPRQRDVLIAAMYHGFTHAGSPRRGTCRSAP